jgi:transmembrane sensor
VGDNRQEQGSDRDRIAAEAARWWSQIELGSADLSAFEEWRNAAPDHAVAFARVQASWETLADHVDAQGLQTAGARSGISRRRMLTVFGAGAAAVAVGGGFFAAPAFAWSHARTAVGEFRRIMLPDASVLELNTDSAVAWRFTQTTREIRLEQGEIAMLLLPGAPATLAVQAETVRLTGGQFIVRLQGDKVGLTVIRGEANAGRKPDRAAMPVRIEPGERAELTATTSHIQQTTTEDRVMLTAWQGGDIVFTDESLQTAADEYNRYLTRKIVVDPVMRNLRVGGRFTTTDPNAFLRAVELGLDAQVRPTADGILIAKK